MTDSGMMPMQTSCIPEWIKGLKNWSMWSGFINRYKKQLNRIAPGYEEKTEKSREVRDKLISDVEELERVLRKNRAR